MLSQGLPIHKKYMVAQIRLVPVQIVSVPIFIPFFYERMCGWLGGWVWVGGCDTMQSVLREFLGEISFYRPTVELQLWASNQTDLTIENLTLEHFRTGEWI